MTRGRLFRILGLGLPLLLIAPHAVTAGEVEQGAEKPDTELAIEYERYTLDNGMEVILHRDTSAPLVAVNIWYHVGSGDEVPGKSGFAHLFEHMMFQGAKHIGEDVHFDILREIGGTGVNGTTNSDRTNYFETVPSHELETALWLESDRMGYMLDLLNEESLANQIDVVRNERRQRYDNVPYGRERFAVAAALYPEGHPYRYLTIGRHENLEAASLDDVISFFEKWYVPSNATLVLAGDLEIDEAKALVDKWFGSFPKLAKPEHVVVPAPELAKTVRTEIDDPFARLERMHFVWHSPAMLAEDDLELDVVAAALGSSGWGRLSKRLVDDEKIAQSVRVYQAGSGFSGSFSIIVTLSPGDGETKRAQAAKAIQEEVDKLVAEGPTKDELARHVISVESSFVWGLEELGGRANQLQWFNHYTGDPNYTDHYLERLRGITPAAVKAAAAKWLTKPRAEIISIPAPPDAKSDAKSDAKKGPK
ncbi:Peptidase M16 inactive domain protein [Enhygromyxa salina]|uniref:Peptidase M16 inactive domain protein n=1 Tax=Enhygromyxa salina TaxID=215803 RepID=A0A2S9Y867_9BACT|nr:pitrilysin family protein [Enhygromyxa salina]PRQ01304.1 Peptidase M16 inactive domain protein [Enhygromyxa salina]